MCNTRNTVLLGYPPSPISIVPPAQAMWVMLLALVDSGDPVALLKVRGRKPARSC